MRAKSDGATPIKILAPASLHFPALSPFTAQPQACKRLRDFFSSNIRNQNTRRAYKEAVRKFSAFCTQHGIKDLAHAEPVHIAAFVEDRLRENSKPVENQRLAVLWMLFDWMVAGLFLSVNPAHAMCGPKATRTKGKTPVLTSDKARPLLDFIDTASLPGLRDRALTALSVRAVRVPFMKVSVVLCQIDLTVSARSSSTWTSKWRFGRTRLHPVMPDHFP